MGWPRLANQAYDRVRIATAMAQCAAAISRCITVLIVGLFHCLKGKLTELAAPDSARA
jgi:hypothetical protein